jgi:EAL domain-containing protein (putative c-di-GMP-specific phosphodiesterase class I)
LIGPDELLSLMEKQNKATMLTEWLIENACKQLLHWRTVGFNPGLISVPVTLSQVTNSRFVYRLSQLLQNLHFNPEWMMLDIKDGQEQVSFDVVEKAFNMLSYVGVHLAIDHFGIGSSGLKFLKNFPIRYIKLDASLVGDIEFNQRTFSVVEALVFMARNLTLQVIASGVETPQQLAVLRELGCYLIQGPAVGAKLSEQEVAAKMISPAG